MGHQVTVHLGFPITSWVSLNLLRRPQPEAVAVGGARPVQDQGAREPLARPPPPPPSCPTPLPQPSPVGRRGSTHPAGGGRDAPPPPPRPAGRRGQSAHHAERDRRLHRSRGPEWRGAGRRGRLSTGQSCAWRAWSFARCERNGGWWREHTRMSRRRAAAWPSGQRPGGTGWKTRGGEVQGAARPGARGNGSLMQRVLRCTPRPLRTRHRSQADSRPRPAGAAALPHRRPRPRPAPGTRTHEPRGRGDRTNRGYARAPLSSCRQQPVLRERQAPTWWRADYVLGPLQLRVASVLSGCGVCLFCPQTLSLCHHCP